MLLLTPLQVFPEGNKLPRNEEFGFLRIRNIQNMYETENALWYEYINYTSMVQHMNKDQLSSNERHFGY